ncbi:hypothetical protein JMJ35_009408 [Cladonia borealis]|uniref:Uncharacterized protein n=1 Tax=Cladonia borealis TaxID=184061 RepID=A0AA39QUU5_9LECA|nr:hypothetical protein JMJ35_009408 [Cladonia borealis]
MYFAAKLITLSALAAMCSGAAVQRDGESALQARDTISIVISDDKSHSGTAGLKAVDDCDDQTCKTQCYQTGKGLTGSCGADGECVCENPDFKTLKLHTQGAAAAGSMSDAAGSGQGIQVEPVYAAPAGARVNANEASSFIDGVGGASERERC